MRDQLALDTVLMVVAGEPWQKVGARPLTAAVDRLAMTAAAVEGIDGLEVCDLEVRRPGPTYTVDTMAQLRAAHPGDELFLVLGADAAAGLGTWERAEGLAAMSQIVVVDRPGTTAEVPERFAVQRVEAPRLDLSSTEMRDRIRDGRSVRFLVPDPVRSVIAALELYGDRP